MNRLIEWFWSDCFKVEKLHSGALKETVKSQKLKNKMQRECQQTLKERLRQLMSGNSNSLSFSVVFFLFCLISPIATYDTSVYRKSQRTISAILPCRQLANNTTFKDHCLASCPYTIIVSHTGRCSCCWNLFFSIFSVLINYCLEWITVTIVEEGTASPTVF